MPTFAYRAISERGTPVTGEAAAPSADALAQKLLEKGLVVETSRPVRAAGRGFLRRRGVGSDALLLLVQEVIALLRAGLPVPEILEHLRDRPDEPRLAEVLAQVTEDVHQGTGVSDACARHPDVFDPLVVAAMRTGERTGDLVSALSHYQQSLKRRLVLGRQLSQAMSYPLFLVLTLAVVLAVLFVFVLPRFVAMYADFNAELPWATRMLLSAVNGFPFYGLPLIALGAGLTWFARAQMQSEQWRHRLDEIRIRFPALGPVIRIHATAQMARTLAALLGSGMPLVEAMHVAASALHNRVYRGRLDDAAEQVSEGRTFADSLGDSGLVPGTAIKMIRAGEASGSLEERLSDLAEHFEELLAHRLNRLATLIEPALMLLMGILVGGIIVVMYLPVFSMAGIVQ